MNHPGAKPMVELAGKINRKYYRNKCDTVILLQDLMLFTTANWDKLEPLWNAQIAYAEHEGLHYRELWASKVRAQLKRRGRKR